MNQQVDERQQLAVVKTVLSKQNIISHALLQKNTMVKELVAGWEVELVCLYVVLTNASCHRKIIINELHLTNCTLQLAYEKMGCMGRQLSETVECLTITIKHFS